MIREMIGKLVERKDLTEEEAKAAMEQIMDGKATESQISAFLTALRMKGETVYEIKAFAEVMRLKSAHITPKVQGRLVDTCGTGGAELKTFNISTIAAFVAAGAGVPVAKHGNRSVTSKCGSADVLEALGVNLKQEPPEVQRSIEKTGIGFLFAPTFHPAMRYAAKTRADICIRTVLNVLGPLTNPAGAKGQVIGVMSQDLVKKITDTLSHLSVEKGLVVYGVDGIDEISTVGKTVIGEIDGDTVKHYELLPTDFDVIKASPDDLYINSVLEGSQVMRGILCNEVAGSKRDAVVINAAAAIYVGGKADTIEEGIDVANDSLNSERAYRKLHDVVRLSGGDLSKLERL